MLSNADKSECLNGLRSALIDKDPMASLINEIKKYIPRGLDQDSAMDLLNDIHKSASLEDQSLIEDVGDLVWGYCHYDDAIFPNRISKKPPKDDSVPVKWNKT